MSANDGWEPEHVVQYSTVVADKRLANTFFVVAFAILTYDHFLTLPAEVRFIWAHPRRPSALWFLLNRYYALGTNLLMAGFTFVDIAPEKCAALLLAKKLFLMGQQVIVYVILVLRVYAMFNLNRRLLVGLLGAGLVVAAVGGWLTTSHADRHPHAPPPPFASGPPSMNGTGDPDYDLPNQSNGFLPLGFALPQCAEPVFRASAIRIAAAWEGVLALEALIFGLTVYRAMAFRRLAGKQHQSSLMRCLLRDGSWYFLAILIVNAANLFMYYFGDPFLAPSLSWLASDLSATLVARLMLNLHEAADAGIYEVQQHGHRLHDQSQSTSSVVFAASQRSPRRVTFPRPPSSHQREWPLPPEVLRYMNQMEETRSRHEQDDERGNLTRLPERVSRRPLVVAGGHGYSGAGRW